ncbi:sensor histidine kinase [Sphingomonas sp.]|uniref:sensor histidine kinase n=1 Tax=Sphingomonas sp. TaxID=28214 RepID=UPI003B3BBF1D
MRRLLRSLSFRLAILYAGLFTGSLLLLFTGYYAIAIRLPLHRSELIVQREAAALQNSYIVDGAAALTARLKARDQVHDHSKAFHAFIDRDGRVVTANLPSWPKMARSGWQRIEADLFVDGDETDFEALAIDRRFADGARLIVGRDVGNISEREAALKSTALFMIGAAVVLGLLGGIFMSRSIAYRLDAVSATARHVMAGDLTQRVPLQGSGDDFDRLAETLNLMLTRIEGAMDAVRRVSDSVAHELRTPLTRLRSKLEDVPDTASPAQAHAAVDDALQEITRMETIFAAVLRISRIEAARHNAAMQTVALPALIEDAADFYRPLAEAKQIALQVSAEQGVEAIGDPDLIFQALTNLLDNAIKYIPARSSIIISAHVSEASVVVAVTDDGPGVDDVYLDKLTERFFRAAPEGVSGIGLGLSLVAAIAALHGDALRLTNQRPGLSAEIRLKRHFARHS